MHTIRIFQPTPAELRAKIRHARVFAARGEFALAEHLLALVRDHVQRESREGALIARALAASAEVARLQGRIDEAEAAYLGAVETFGDAAGADRVELAATLCAFGEFLLERGRAEESEQLVRRALVLDVAHFGHAAAAIVRDLRALGRALCALDRGSEARAVLHELTAAATPTFGADHPYVDEARRALASLGPA